MPPRSLNGGNQALVRAASDRARADALLDARMKAPFTDDERNPPDLGVMERELARVRNARMVWVKGGPDTAGHGTTANAKWWKAEFDAWFRGVPKRTD